MQRRPDGSIASQNNPTWKNRSKVFDTGLYYGIITAKDIPGVSPGAILSSEMTYSVRIIGGERDGQLYPYCRVMRSAGGKQNFQDETLKQSINPSLVDFGSELNFTQLPGQENGDYVFIQFLNGDVTRPIIVGFAKSPLDSQNEVPDTIPFGQHQVKQFNGFKQKIDENGDLIWTKAQGSWLPTFVDEGNPLVPYINEFVPLPTFQEMFKFTVDSLNNLDMGLALAPSYEPLTGTSVPAPRVGLSMNAVTDSFDLYTQTGLGVSMSGITDSIGLSSLAGAAVNISGITDSVELGTLVGTSLAVSGLTDAIDLTTTAGAAISISGLTDTIEATTTSGGTISLSPLSGKMEIPVGSKMELTATGVSLVDATGAGIETSTGFVKIQSAAGVELIDLIDQLITSLSTATYAGFGSPGSNVADLIQLATQIKLIKGA